MEAIYVLLWSNGITYSTLIDVFYGKKGKVKTFSDTTVYSVLAVDNTMIHLN